MEQEKRQKSTNPVDYYWCRKETRARITSLIRPIHTSLGLICGGNSGLAPLTAEDEEELRDRCGGAADFMEEGYLWGAERWAALHDALEACRVAVTNLVEMEDDASLEDMAVKIRMRVQDIGFRLAYLKHDALDHVEGESPDFERLMPHGEVSLIAEAAGLASALYREVAATPLPSSPQEEFTDA